MKYTQAGDKAYCLGCQKDYLNLAYPKGSGHLFCSVWVTAHWDGTLRPHERKNICNTTSDCPYRLPLPLCLALGLLATPLSELSSGSHPSASYSWNPGISSFPVYLRCCHHHIDPLLPMPSTSLSFSPSHPAKCHQFNPVTFVFPLRDL